MRFKVLLALSAMVWASTASADLIFDLTTGNTAINGYTGDYARVDVSLSGQTATITFTSLCEGATLAIYPSCDSGDALFLLGDGSSVAVNVNSTDFSLGTITGSNAGTGFDPGDPYTDGGSGNVNGFGTFNQTIDSFDGYTHTSDTITFTITNNDLNNLWSDVNDVLALNDNGALAAAHIFVASQTDGHANASVDALATGFAAGSGGSVPPEEIPEPGVLGLIGIAVLGMGLIAIRQRAA